MDLVSYLQIIFEYMIKFFLAFCLAFFVVVHSHSKSLFFLFSHIFVDTYEVYIRLPLPSSVFGIVAYNC